MNKIFIYGSSSCGKTTLLSVIADQLWLQKFKNKMWFGYSIDLAKLAFLSPNQGGFPDPTPRYYYKEYCFDIFHRDNTNTPIKAPKLSFTICDYSGSDISEIKYSPLIEQLEYESNDADQIIVMIDGLALLKQLKIQSKNINFATLSLDYQFSRTKIHNFITRCKAKNKKVDIIISKCDFTNNYIETNELIKKTRGEFKDILNKDTIIIPLSSVGFEGIENRIISVEKKIGDRIIKVSRLTSKFNSFLKPYNIDVLFAVIFRNFKNATHCNVNNCILSDMQPLNELDKIVESIYSDFIRKYPEAISIID